VSAWGRSRVS